MLIERLLSQKTCQFCPNKLYVADAVSDDNNILMCCV